MVLSLKASLSPLIAGLCLALSATALPASAQTSPITVSLSTEHSAPAAAQDAASALRAMDDQTLSLTYARIDHAFRMTLGQDDLSLARQLIDYAALAEAELARRALPLPQNARTSAELQLAYELVL